MAFISVLLTGYKAKWQRFCRLFSFSGQYSEPPDREATLWDTAPYGRDILPLDSRPEQVLKQIPRRFFRTGLIFGESLMLSPQEVLDNRSCKPIVA